MITRTFKVFTCEVTVLTEKGKETVMVECYSNNPADVQKRVKSLEQFKDSEYCFVVDLKTVATQEKRLGMDIDTFMKNAKEVPAPTPRKKKEEE